MPTQTSPVVNKMANLPPPPPVKWAQRPSLIFLTICLEDCKDPKIEVKPSFLRFEGNGGPDKKDYAVTIEFLKEIDPDKSKYAVNGRVIEFALEKKGDGPYWERLLKDKAKQHWLKVDFNKWKEEDESDDEAGGGQDLEQMMAQMGGMGGMPGMGGMAGMGGMPGMGSMPGMGGMPGMSENSMERPNLDDLDADESDNEDLPDLE